MEGITVGTKKPDKNTDGDTGIGQCNETWKEGRYVYNNTSGVQREARQMSSIWRDTGLNPKLFQ